MINTIFSDTKNRFEWIDVTNPSQEEYKYISEKYHLHPAALKDCLSPLHLPKAEKIEDVIFMICRILDERANDIADTIQQLTNKIALFVSDRFIITIHRRTEPFFEKVIKKWGSYNTEFERDTLYRFKMVNHLLDSMLHTYDPVIKRVIDIADEYEKEIFEGTKNPLTIRNLYIMKRKSSVFKRMLFLSKNALDKYIRFTHQQDNPFSTDLLETADSMFFLADELHENANNLLNLHLSFASHRTNEIMGVLTISSVFFWPLTFIVGLYGMNFEFMPELHSEYGYPAVWGLMITMVVGIYLFFKRRGWL